VDVLDNVDFQRVIDECVYKNQLINNRLILSYLKKCHGVTDYSQLDHITKIVNGLGYRCEYYPELIDFLNNYDMLCYEASKWECKLNDDICNILDDLKNDNQLDNYSVSFTRSQSNNAHNTCTIVISPTKSAHILKYRVDYKIVKPTQQ